MSHDSVGVVERLYEAWAQGEVPGPAGLPGPDDALEAVGLVD